tara:strand:- start:47866 stop:49053 length:1188 start_codon:yes stop_codon:yes gene_type:complete
MNLIKYTKNMNLIKYTTITALLTGVASAQGLFNVNPISEEKESSPLKYTLETSFGYDDNVNPTSPSTSGVGSAYSRANLGASLAVRDEQTSWDLSATVGATYYENNAVPNDVDYNGRLQLNLNHRINDRVRLISRNYINYGLDLGNFYGVVASRELEEYTYATTDNSIGYRWTDRLGTYTGISYSTANYDGSNRDVDNFSVYNEFRYWLSFQTTLTAEVNYSKIDHATNDNDRITSSVGVDYRITDNSRVVVKVGAQFSDRNNAFGDISYISKVNSQFKTRIFARYSQQDTDGVFNGQRYEDQINLNFGAAVDYALSSKVTLTTGANYNSSDFKDAPSNPDGETDTFNIYAGATYMINDAFSLNASLNYTNADAVVIPNRDFNRTRFQVGANYTF